MQALQSETYDFNAKPRVVKPKSKFREPEEQADFSAQTQNLMYHSKVIRGNTYAVPTSNKNTDQKEMQKILKNIKNPVKKQPNYQASSFGNQSHY